MLKSLSYGVATCGFALDDYDDDCVENTAWQSAEPDTDRTSRIGQAGNAMHTESVGIMIAYVLSRGNCCVSQLDAENFGKLTPPDLATDARSASRAAVTSGVTRTALSSNLLGLAKMIKGRR